MRLNLGEIAMSLGCNPGMVIWDGLGAGTGRMRVVESAPSSLKALARQRALGVSASRGEYDPVQGFDCFEHAPWAGLICTGAQIDSRNTQPGNLFFCLPGEHADGHDFAFDAARAGAIAIVASRNPWSGKAGDAADLILPPVFLVDDVRRALARVAKCHRETCLARVIGITGTAGKTSVKEVLAQVLEMRGRTERNPLNLNNQIGLPVSMLNASADASFWVMEMGISEDGDMDELGEILHPDVGVILNVGDGHVSGLGELGVAVHKARLLDYIQPGGAAVISTDYADLNRQVDERLSALSRRGVQVLRFSHLSNNDVFARAAYVGSGAEGGIYKVWTKDFHFEVNTPFRGDFGSENVAAIAAVAIKLGLSQEAISEGFASARLPEQRFRAECYPRCTLLDDSYNANPLSSSRMLQAARSMADEYGQSLVLVMGEMLELGPKAESAHEALGENMAAVKPEMVFWKGGQADAIARGLRKGGYSGQLYPLSGAQEFDLLLEESDLDNVLVLFKGSRGNKLERLVAVFREKVSPAGEN
jgi:UDP-N-acetylmuramoyl-tripeptide--D-alanyl-D-alanine ligase